MLIVRPSLVCDVPSALIPQGLTLLEVLIKSGSERVVDDARDHLFRIRTLTDFTHHDETSDKGHGGAFSIAGSRKASSPVYIHYLLFAIGTVREKSKQLVELLNDTARIREERAKTRELKSKYVGIGTEGGCTFSPFLIVCCSTVDFMCKRASVSSNFHSRSFVFA